MSAHTAHTAPTAPTAHAVRGLAVAEDDLRVVVAQPELLRFQVAGRVQTVAFTQEVS